MEKEYGEGKQWKPTTMEESLEFERAKAGIVNPAKQATEEKTRLQIGELKAKQEETERIKQRQTENILDSAQDTLATISKVKEGIKYFGLSGLVPAIPGMEPKKVDWQTNLEKLLSQRILNLMTEMKQASRTGATGFGQLSEKELKVLQEGSTALRKFTSEKEAMNILNNMETKLKKIISKQSTTVGNFVSNSQQTDFSQMSDEELRRLAYGE